MSERGFAYFVKRPRRIEDLMCPHLIEQEREYEVMKTITLPAIDFENFITDMAADRQFLEDNAELCSTGSESVRCIKVSCKGRMESVLVAPDSAWVDIAAVIKNSVDGYR